MRGGAAARQRSGRRRDPRLLCRLLPLLRAAFPRARFLVRLDGGFATPEVFDFLDAEPRLDYVVAMAKNAVLERHAESALQTARTQSEVTWQALNTAHGGSLTTGHANNAESALSRLASCTMRGGGDLPRDVMCRRVADGIAMVIHLGH